MLLIANDSNLGPEWLDHPLGANGQGTGSVMLGATFFWPTSLTAGSSTA